jgi:hypothetical protein
MKRPPKRRDNDSQIGTIVPNWIGEVSGEGVDQNLILVEFQDYVRKPPVTPALHALAI